MTMKKTDIVTLNAVDTGKLAPGNTNAGDSAVAVKPKSQIFGKGASSPATPDPSVYGDGTSATK